MSWPSTDFEVAIQTELDELRHFVVAVRAILENHDEDEHLSSGDAIEAIRQIVPGARP